MYCPVCHSDYIYKDASPETSNDIYCYSCGWGGTIDQLEKEKTMLTPPPYPFPIPDKFLGIWKYRDDRNQTWCLETTNLYLEVGKFWAHPWSTNSKYYMKIPRMGLNEFDKMCELTEDVEESKKMALARFRGLIQMNLQDLPSE